MRASSSPRGSIDSLVDRMFEQVLDAEERAELLDRIRAWEAAHPDVDNASRLTAWIDVAYEMQAARRASDEARGPVRTRSNPDEPWGWATVPA